MRILWCHPNAWSGEYKMMRYLATQGHDVCVLQENRKLGPTRARRDHFREPGDRIRTLWYNPARGIEKLLTFPVDRIIRRSPYRGNIGHRMWMIRTAARHFQPDVVYCSEGFSYGVAAAVLRKLGGLPAPLVVQFIGGDLMDEPAADYGVRRTPVSHWLLRQVMTHATLLKPVSPLLAALMEQEGAAPAKIRMSPSHLVSATETLRATWHDRAAIAGEVRATYGIPAAAPLIVSLSGNWMGKGTQFLAQGWASLRQQVPGCRWLLGGPHPDWYVHHVQAMVERYPGEIIQTGVLHGDEVFRCLAAADLNVNPTLADGLNMVTVEAAAIGTPSVVTDKAGIADWVARCAPGMVLPAGDGAALQQGIAAFFRLPPPERQALGEKFRALSAEFELERLAGRLGAILAEAAGG